MENSAPKYVRISEEVPEVADLFIYLILNMGGRAVYGWLQPPPPPHLF